MRTSNHTKSIAIEKIARELWNFVKLFGEAYENIVFTPYGKLRVRKIPRNTYYTKLRKFENNGLLKKIKKSYGNEFILTPKARKLRIKPATKTKRQDEFSTIILFDIPEKKRKARDVFRRFLIRNGYTQIQKSAFISPFQLSSDLLGLVEELHIRQNISYIIGKVNYPAR